MSRLNLSKHLSDDLLPIHQSLPMAEELNQLHQAFKLYIHPILPLCHLPSLDRAIVKLGSDDNAEIFGDSLALKLAVAYCGLVSINDEQYAESLTSIYNSYDRLLSILEFPNDVSNATVPLLQSYLYINSCRASQIEALSSFGFLSQAVRVAQALKLHLERKSSPPIEKAVQRCIWWHLVYLDVEAALVSGLPLLIHADDYTTLMPSEFDDETIAVGQKCLSPNAVTLVKSTFMLAMHGRWQWALQMRKWRRKRTVTSQDFSVYEEVMDNLRSQLSPVGDSDWAQSYLNLHVSRVVCSAARSFLDGKSLSNAGCDDRLLR